MLPLKSIPGRTNYPPGLTNKLRTNQEEVAEERPNVAGQDEMRPNLQTNRRGLFVLIIQLVVQFLKLLNTLL